MAHTLSVVDGVEATTLALANTAAAGYHLIAYNPVMSAYLDQRNASLYTPGDYSVMGKYQNIIETITCEIVGASRDDLFVKLRALYRAIENARDYFQNRGMRTPSYLSYKPDSTTNTSYSVITGGRVDIPGTDASIAMGAGGEGEQLNNTMTGIVITIERESYWRAYPPAQSATIANWSTVWLNSGYDTGVVNWFGKLTADGGTYPLITGDIPALTEIRAALRNVADGLTLDKIVIGYRSAERGGAAHNLGGVWEAESGVQVTDTAITTDASASPGGGGNTKSRCTFATVATDAKRVYMNTAPQVVGAWRVFGRMAMSAGASTATVHANVALKSGSDILLGKSVTVSGTTWAMYDLGVMDINPGAVLAFDQNTQRFDGIYLYAARVTGAASLDIDCLFIVPCDEYYAQVTGMAITSVPNGGLMRIGNIAPVSQSCQVIYEGIDLAISPQSWAVPTWAGDIRFPPGAGTLYFLCGDASWGNLFETTNRIRFYVFHTPLYLSARGNG